VIAVVAALPLCRSEVAREEEEDRGQRALGPLCLKERGGGGPAQLRQRPGGLAGSAGLGPVRFGRNSAFYSVRQKKK
jgi:hypothetical protein